MKLAALLVALTACSQHLYSPPTQAFALAPVATLAPNEKALDGDLSSHSQIFDPGYQAGSARLRYGIASNTEVSIEGMAATVAGGAGPSNHDVYGSRAGIRWSPSGAALTFNAGVGGGFAPAAGYFTAADFGAQVGYDNCYVVPVAAFSTFMSVPLNPRPVDVGSDGVEVNAMAPADVYSTPRLTGGSTFRTGLRVSLSPSSCHAGKQVPWLTAGFDITEIADETSHAELVGVGFGFTVPL